MTSRTREKMTAHKAGQAPIGPDAVGNDKMKEDQGPARRRPLGDPPPRRPQARRREPGTSGQGRTRKAPRAAQGNASSTLTSVAEYNNSPAPACSAVGPPSFRLLQSRGLHRLVVGCFSRLPLTLRSLGYWRVFTLFGQCPSTPTLALCTPWTVRRFTAYGRS